MIEASNLWKTFGDFTAVQEISFDVKEGEIFGIAGPNGAGKSTIVKMLCTILEPTRGTASINGFDILKDSKKIREIIGYLPEEPRVYDYMNGVEYLELFADMYGTKNDVHKLLEFVGLKEHELRKVGDYSKGMKQRLSIARALVHEPEILILDEPTMGLDPSSARELREKILDMKKKKKTIVLCTHYMDEADFLCDKLVILEKGKIAAYDRVDVLKEKHAKTRKIRISVIEEIPIEQLETIFQGERRGRKIEIPVDGNVESRTVEIIEKALHNNLHILSLETVYPSLEEVFVEVIKDKSFV